jgi:predicted O-methyltransferase YrrM
LPLAKRFLSTRKNVPAVLEVGIDRGVTFMPIASFLARTRKEFTVIGVDVLVQEPLAVTVQNLDLGPSVYMIQANSLDVLPKLVEQGMTFDLVFLDGDHNYFTVSHEMKLMDKLVKADGILIIDDYDGRWSERDLFYAQREGYEDNKFVTKPVNTEKHGVKPAVDEWLAENPNWEKHKPINGEPVLLARKGTLVL